MRGISYKDRADMRRKGAPRPQPVPLRPAPKPGEWVDALLRQAKREPSK